MQIRQNNYFKFKRFSLTGATKVGRTEQPIESRVEAETHKKAAKDAAAAERFTGRDSAAGQTTASGFGARGNKLNEMAESCRRLLMNF